MSPAPFRAAAVQVPCSTSNLGAGFDCIGLALERHLTARYTPEVSGTLGTEYTGTLAGLGRGGDGAAFGDAPFNLLTRAFTGRMRALGVMRVTGRITAHSEIPIARGLGSSAASIVGGILLADAVLGRAPDPMDMLAIATDHEGHPDNAAPALLGGLVAVARGEDRAPVAFRLPLSDRITFVYAAPASEVLTPAARAALPPTVPHPVAARGLGRMAALLQGLASADPTLLQLGLLDELHVPYRLPLIPRASETLRAAVDAGAWGATISGSGSGLIALCAHDAAAAVLAAMEQALAPSGLAITSFITAADPEGAHVLQQEQLP
ncbi:MAG: homoserine kinase [Gemmatimonadetes bacterium]|nr:homoserine kinase [Gemmatimonadota bacterium]